VKSWSELAQAMIILEKERASRQPSEEFISASSIGGGGGVTRTNARRGGGMEINYLISSWS
jgi:hypothetical protein